MRASPISIRIYICVPNLVAVRRENEQLHPVVNIGISVEEGRSYGGEGPGFPVERLGDYRASQLGDQSPHHPATNGQDERTNQSIKNGMKKYTNE